MIGVEFRLSMSDTLYRYLGDTGLSHSELALLIKQTPDVCQESCVQTKLPSNNPVLNLSLVESFLGMIEKTVNSQMRRILVRRNLKADRQIRVLCFHIPPTIPDGLEPVLIHFFFYDTTDAEPAPVARVMCPIVPAVVFH